MIVVRAAQRTECPDFEFEWQSKAKKARKDEYVCTQLNANVGDCFNSDDRWNKLHTTAHLYKLRRVTCSEPGAFQVNTRADKTDIDLCSTARRTAKVTTRVYFKQPPASFCLHRVGS